MMGCSRRSAWSSTNTRLRWHAARSSGEPFRRAFENSMYQSQNSFQKNENSSRVISPNSKFPYASSTRATSPARRENIQRSAGVTGSGAPGT